MGEEEIVVFDPKRFLLSFVDPVRGGMKAIACGEGFVRSGDNTRWERAGEAVLEGLEEWEQEGVTLWCDDPRSMPDRTVVALASGIVRVYKEGAEGEGRKKVKPRAEPRADRRRGWIVKFGKQIFTADVRGAGCVSPEEAEARGGLVRRAVVCETREETEGLVRTLTEALALADGKAIEVYRDNLEEVGEDVLGKMRRGEKLDSGIFFLDRLRDGK